jgi:hypothetical protein
VFVLRPSGNPRKLAIRSDSFRYAMALLTLAVFVSSAAGQSVPSEPSKPAADVSVEPNDDDDAVAHRRRGEALYRSDSTDPANLRKAFDALQESYRLADKKRDASGVAERFPPPEMKLCRLAVEMGHEENAARYADDLRRELPKYVQANPAERVRCGMFLAEHFLVQGNTSVLIKEMEAGKFSADDLRRIVAIMRYFANDPRAVEELTRLHDEFPDDERISNYLARILADSEKPADRSRALKVAIANQAAHPSSFSSRCTLAWARLRSGDSRAAVEAIRPVLEQQRAATASDTGRRPLPLDRINSDDAYLLAKAIYLDESMPGRIDAVIALLKKALETTGPFRYRSRAEEWLK